MARSLVNHSLLSKLVVFETQRARLLYSQLLYSSSC